MVDTCVIHGYVFYLRKSRSDASIFFLDVSSLVSNDGLLLFLACERKIRFLVKQEPMGH